MAAHLFFCFVLFSWAVPPGAVALVDALLAVMEAAAATGGELQ